MLLNEKKINLSNKIKNVYLSPQWIKNLKKHNELYYSKDNPKVTDKKYDELKQSILDKKLIVLYF